MIAAGPELGALQHKLRSLEIIEARVNHAHEEVTEMIKPIPKPIVVVHESPQVIHVIADPPCPEEPIQVIDDCGCREDAEDCVCQGEASKPADTDIISAVKQAKEEVDDKSEEKSEKKAKKSEKKAKKAEEKAEKEDDDEPKKEKLSKKKSKKSKKEEKAESSDSDGEDDELKELASGALKRLNK